MGFGFDIQQANIAAYLTTLNCKPPRISYGNFYAFLSVLSGRAEVDPQRLFTSSAEARVIGFSVSS